MKRLPWLLYALILLAVPVFAQQDNPNIITLNDATPAIDVVITLPPDTTGTVALDLAQASVQLLDSSGAVVFSAADARLHALEINIAPNSGSHTLTVERLAGAAEALVSVSSLPEMTVSGTVQVVTTNAVNLNEEAALELNATHPGGTVSVNIPTETTGVVTALFPGAYATSQLIDAQGLVVAESTGGHVDGLTFVLDSGDYQFTLLSNGLTETVVAGVRVVSSADGGFAVLEAPVTATAEAAPASSGTCTAVITTRSVNLRSGPGTGYSVLDYGYRGQTLEVGGRNPQNNWLLVGSDVGSAWLTLGAVQMQGACDALTVFDIPLLEASPAPFIITSPNSNGLANGGGENDHEEHEHENDDDEGDDDD